MYRLVPLVLLFLTASPGCRPDRHAESPPETQSPFPPGAAAAAQAFCDSIAGASGAGIAVADLRNGALMAVAGRHLIAETCWMPASTFKVVTAIAALLHHAAVPPGFACTGSVEIAGETIHCWDRKGHGVQTLAQAIQNSCNCYFAMLASRCRSEQLAAAARACGYGEKTDFGIPGESAGFLASVVPEEKRVLFGLGHTPYCHVTGLQLLRFAATLATKGRFIGRPDLLDWERIDPVLQGMEQAVIYGTGRAALLPDYPAAGKTGTLEGDVRWKAHGWFFGYAPYDAPEVAVVVFCEDGTGSAAASPIAGAVLKKLFELRESPS